MDVKAVEAAFDLADEDENGEIDPIEFRSLELILVEAGFNPNDVKQAFNDMDSDGNGTISKGEFVAWWFSAEVRERNAQLRDAMPPALDLRAAFDLVDEDGNGLIDRDEMARLESALVRAGFDPGLVRGAFAEMDSDGDGQVSKAEIIAWWFSASIGERSQRLRDAMLAALELDGGPDDRFD